MIDDPRLAIVLLGVLVLVGLWFVVQLETRGKR